jgi:hypothetical protein
MVSDHEKISPPSSFEDLFCHLQQFGKFDFLNLVICQLPK